MPNDSHVGPHVFDSRYGDGQGGTTVRWRVLTLTQGRVALAMVAGGRRTEIVLQPEELTALARCLRAYTSPSARLVRRVRRWLSATR